MAIKAGFLLRAGDAKRGGSGGGCREAARIRAPVNCVRQLRSAVRQPRGGGALPL